MDAFSIFFTPGIGFLLTLAFGFWLGKKGKPYNATLFNIHKLIALGVVIMLVARVYSAPRDLETSSLFIMLLRLGGLCIVALFASGAFMGIEKFDYKTMKSTHDGAFFMALVTMAAAVYLLGGG
jgi:hypothetical protein